MNKKYVVYITETLTKTVVVEAEDKETAINKVDKEYSDGNIILDYENFTNVDFKAVEEK